MNILIGFIHLDLYGSAPDSIFIIYVTESDFRYTDLSKCNTGIGLLCTVCTGT
jgi:hypothetical protein